MITASVALRIDAPADRVWKMISGAELRDLVIGTYVKSIEVNGEGEGTVFTTTFANGSTILERVEKLDDAEREYTFSVIDSGPLKYAYYVATMRAQPAGPDATLLSARVNFIAESGFEEQTREGWIASNTAKFKMIADHLAANK